MIYVAKGFWQRFLASTCLFCFATEYQETKSDQCTETSFRDVIALLRCVKDYELIVLKYE